MGSILKLIGGFSIVMTVFHLWRVGFQRLRGPEGETWGGVLPILLSYAIMGIVSVGIAGLGLYIGSLPRKKVTETKKVDVAITSYCPKCGYTYPEGFSVCSGCGTELVGYQHSKND